MTRIFKVTLFTEKEYINLQFESDKEDITLKDIAEDASYLLSESDFVGDATKDDKRFIAIKSSDVKKIAVEEIKPKEEK